jgi:hypothetical protein
MTPLRVRLADDLIPEAVPRFANCRYFQNLRPEDRGPVLFDGEPKMVFEDEKNTFCAPPSHSTDITASWV